jgi:hypothetical protein
MKTKKITVINLLSILSFMLLLHSCKKENSVQTSSATATAIDAAKAVAVGISTTSNDSIYVIGTCARDHHLDSVSFASLSSAITTYLTTNYGGYTFQKSYTDNDSSGNIAGYVVIIQFNGNPVGLKFDAAGTFIKVLEQREGHDLTGRGWHEGGHFDDRDGKHRDTINLAFLPSEIASYFAANYSQDTLVKAYKGKDSGYIIYSINNGAFATIFDSAGSFVKRIELHTPPGNFAPLKQAGLASSILSYLSSTYPNYVFKQAFSFFENSTLSGYIVCIDANGTRYAVQFDLSGNFIRAITIG